jgi:hypothetical protein
MASQQEQFLKALIERFPHPGMKDAVEALPQELALKFKNLPERIGKSPEAFFIQPKRVLKDMHPSWSEELVLLCPGCLQSLLRKVLLDTVEGKEMKEGGGISDSIKEFLLGYLVSKWPDRNMLGIENIEGASFSWLATADSKMISLLGELLPVNDIVDVVRKIVDKKILQRILSGLSAVQQRYLRSLLHRPSRSSALNQEVRQLLQEDAQKVAHVLACKGQEELAYAIKDEPELLLWHLMHRIEREKAFALKKMMEKQISQGEQTEMKKRLSHAFQFLQKVETQ